MSQIILIAKNELSRLVRQPIIILLVCIVLALSAINGMSAAAFISDVNLGHDPFLIPGLGNAFYNNSIFLSALSAFIGVMAIGGDRSTNSIRVLLTKPLYKRDVLAGKYLGMLALILMIAAFCVLFGVAMLLIFFGGPESASEAIIRICTYVLMLFLNCALTAAITMAIGVLVKNLLGTLICVGSLFFFEWQVSLHGTILDLLGGFIYLNQRILFFTAIGPGNINLFLTDSPYLVWLDNASQYIVAMVIALLAFMSLSFYVFCREDE
ncbi:ABC transporter permease [Methanocella sp. MCL-LM]|uniref:ABC transporter permease n=1 Tax=Methanocella sp. MCL-LM TaxID=3412035 RepID=UPI003C781732